MRRILLTVVASSAMLAIAPATSLAHHHGRHHRHARVEHFGSNASQTGASQSSSSSTDNAGTVSSFSGGVLTIKLNDGSTVSGQVTSDTEMECQAPENTTTHDDGGDGSGDNSSGDNSSGDNSSGDNSSGEDNQQSTTSGQQSGSDEATENENQAAGSDNQNGEDDNGNAQSCGTAKLTPGTVVREAELRVTSTGSTWKKVELITQ